jgi:hypothetical protein
MKESLARIAAWAKSHPLYAVLIVGGIALIGYLVYKNSPKLASLASTGVGEQGDDEGNLTGGLTGDLGTGLDPVLPDYIYPYDDPAYYTGGGGGVPSNLTTSPVYYSDPTTPISPTGRTGTPISLQGLDLSVAYAPAPVSNGRRDSGGSSSGGPTPGHRETYTTSPSPSSTSGRRSLDVIKSGAASTKGPPAPAKRTPTIPQVGRV